MVPPPDMSSRPKWNGVEVSSQVTSFSLRRLILQLEWIPHSAGAPVGMTYVSGLVVTNLNIQRFRLTPDGDGSSPLHLYRVLGDSIHPHRLYSLRCLAMNHRRYIGYTIYRVISFNQTGYLRNVAGGRLPPLHCIPLRLWRTFAFIHLAQKRMSKFGKKHLTNVGCCGNICKLSDERPPNGPEGGETLKNSLKKVKKGLDKLLRMC